MKIIWEVIKIVIAVFLFLFGTLFFAVGVTSIPTIPAAGGIAIVMAMGFFAYPIIKIVMFVSERKNYGKQWIALPAVAISIPLLFTTCMAAAEGSTKKKSVESSSSSMEQAVSVVDETQSASSEEPSESSTETVVTSETSETILEETTNETTVEETTTETTVEETTKQTEETTKQTEATTKQPESPTQPPPETTEPPKETQAPSEEKDYVLNNNTHKFHLPSCSSVGDIKASNREDRHCTREKLIEEGYKPCKKCNP